MSNGENGKNGKASQTELDRLLKLIDAIARIDTKVESLSEQCKIDVTRVKEITDILEKRLLSIETEGAKPIRELLEQLKCRIDVNATNITSLEQRRSELVQLVANCDNKIDRIEEGITRWKIYWGAVTFIVVPLFTYLIVKLLNVAFHLAV